MRSDITLDINTGSNELIVKETATGAILKKLLITGLPDDAFAFELDHRPNNALKKKYKNAFNQLSCLVCDGHDYANKKCDFILLVQEAGAFEVIIADMKSKSPDRAKSKKQLRNSELFFKYLLSLVQEYHKPDLATPIVHKIVFYVPNRPNKPVTYQKNAKRYEISDGVKFFPVPLSGYRGARVECI